MTKQNGSNSPLCFFVSDLHGKIDRYEKLFSLIAGERPAALFMGGDILPTGRSSLAALRETYPDFLEDFIIARFKKLRQQMGAEYPRIFLIMGNDDPRAEESAVISAASEGVWEYVHHRRVTWKDYQVYGYACVPPTPFLLKDWERYDVSPSVNPGCIPPEEGLLSIRGRRPEPSHSTIARDLSTLTGDENPGRAILLFHSPPYRTKLDRIAIDGTTIGRAPADRHVGSRAIRRFIETRQPAVTLHGHIHESARLTGSWKDRLDETYMFSAAHDGPELALVRFDPEHPEKASRTLA
jgi:Icc-related predicted phosphoesterase